MSMSNTQTPQVFVLSAETIASANALAAQGRDESYAKWLEDTKGTDGVYRVGVNLDKQFESKPLLKTTRIRAGLYKVTVGGHEFHVEEVHNGWRWTWRVTDQDVFHDGWFGDYDTKKAAIKAINGE